MVFVQSAEKVGVAIRVNESTNLVDFLLVWGHEL